MSTPTPARSLLALLAVLAACATPAPERSTAATPLGMVPEGWPLFQETLPVEAPRAMVVSSSPLASEVGIEILKQGGNAVDAAVAVGFALTVVHPSAGNLGGGGFLVVRLHDGSVRTLDFRETAPGGATREMYLDSAGNLTETSVTGHLAAGVPGSVAGLAEVLERHGTRSLPSVLAPAITLARDGFLLDETRSRSLEGAAKRLRLFPASHRQFLLPNGEAPPPGTRLRQPDLARTLQAIADSGPRVFYHGYIADLIVAEMARGGGLIDKDDLAAYRAIWRDPVAFTYRRHTIFSMPPASSGGITMAQILNILEGYDSLPPLGSAEHVHLLAESMRRAFIDRNQHLGDPDFVTMPLERLLAKDYAASLRASIDPTRATPTGRIPASVRDGFETTHYSIVDAAGNAVSVTTTLNSSFGSAVTVSGAGFLLNNEMDDFTAAPGVPNQFGLVQGEANTIAPGKRMLSAMSPTIVVDSLDRLLMVLGTPGGPTIITTVSQVVSNVIDHGLSLERAVAAPRVHHQALPDRIQYDPAGLLPIVADQLRSMGHDLEERPGYRGEVTAIMRGPRGWIGVADPRAGGRAIGY